MNTRSTEIVSGIALFAAGFVAGMLFAPKSGDALRSEISRHARQRVAWAEDQLKEVENKLEDMEERIANSAGNLSSKVKEAASVVKIEEEGFDVAEDEVARDLRHLTRK